MKIEDVLIPKNIGKKFKFNLNGQEMITEVKSYYTCGYQKIVLDFIDKIDFEEVEREIDWSKVQVRDSDNHEWQNAYYVTYNSKSDGEYNHCITKRDIFTNPNCYIDGNYKYCRTHPSVKVQEEWYKDYMKNEEDDLE